MRASTAQERTTCPTGTTESAARGQRWSPEFTVGYVSAMTVAESCSHIGPPARRLVLTPGEGVVFGRLVTPSAKKSQRRRHRGRVGPRSPGPRAHTTVNADVITARQADRRL